MDEPIRILGIDPGLRRCGWGVIARSGSRLSHIAHGVIAPPSSGPLADRLAVLYRELCEVVAEHAPHQAAVEEAFVNANPASALKLGHARAAALLAPALSGVPVGEYAPRLIKKAVVGNGGADKNQVATMIGVILPGAKAQADAADALAVAVCHAHHATLAPVLAR